MKRDHIENFTIRDAMSNNLHKHFLFFCLMMFLIQTQNAKSQNLYSDDWDETVNEIEDIVKEIQEEMGLPVDFHINKNGAIVEYNKIFGKKVGPDRYIATQFNIHEIDDIKMVNYKSIGGITMYQLELKCKDGRECCEFSTGQGNKKVFRSENKQVINRLTLLFKHLKKLSLG